jgi:PAS domain S-box-containing protein
MPNPAALSEQRLRKTKAQLIDEIDTLEQRATTLEAAKRSSTPMRAKDREVEFILKAIASENPSPVLRVMPDGTVLYANDAAIAMNGLLKGRKKSTLAGDLAGFCAEVSGIAEVQETEFEIGDRVFAFSIAPVAGEAYVNIYGRDITERKRAEQGLRENEQILETILDRMPGGIKVEDRDMNYLFCNRQYGELYGFPDGIVKVGGSFRDELRYQADRGDFGPGDTDDLIEQLVAIRRRGEAHIFERAIAGSERTLQSYVAPTPEGGTAVIVVDITERKQAEEALVEAKRQTEEAGKLVAEKTACWNRFRTSCPNTSRRRSTLRFSRASSRSTSRRSARS